MNSQEASGTKRYRQALRQIPPPGDGCHCALLGVANLGVWAGLPGNRIEADIRAAIPQGNRRVPDREIRDAVRRAIKDAGVGPADWTPTTTHTGPAIDAGRLMQVIIAAGSDDECDLWEASPYRLDGPPEADAELLLRQLYTPDDILFIGERYDKRVATVDKWIGHIGRNGTEALPHIMPNPVDGGEHPTEGGNLSRRCDAAVCSFRYAVVEFDNLPRWDQLAFWTGILAKDLFDVAAVIDSGRKSLHGWIRTYCLDRASWERDIEQKFFRQWLTPLGADPACRNEARLSRLPGHYRKGREGQKDRWQRLLYLDPKPAHRTAGRRTGRQHPKQGLRTAHNAIS